MNPFRLLTKNNSANFILLFFMNPELPPQNADASESTPADKAEIDRDIQNIEKELSQEATNEIMDKVQDINSEGTAFSVFNNIREKNDRKQTENIFRFGLIADSQDLLEDYYSGEKHLDKKTISNFLRDKRKCPVFFNIVGRGYDFNNLNESTWMKGERSIAVIFDISSFHESEEPICGAWDKNLTDLKFKEYAIDIGLDGRGAKFEDNKIKTSSGHGFVTALRISPRFFKGIVTKNNSIDGIKELLSGIYNAKKENLIKFLIPIYNDRGDLLWPKQMRYEELKNFIEEKSKDNLEK